MIDKDVLGNVQCLVDDSFKTRYFYITELTL